MTRFEKDPIIEIADLRADNDALKASVTRSSMRISELEEEVKRLRALLHVTIENSLYKGEG